MKNKDLKDIYDKIFKKGEEQHFTKNLEQRTNRLPADEGEVLAVYTWKGKRVLDVGSGTGLMAFEIAKQGAARVLGVDYSPEGIQLAQKNYTHPKLEFRCEDIFKSAALKEKFDVIVSLGTLEHMDDPAEALRAFKKLLKPKGSIILTCPNWVNPRGIILMTLKHLFDAPITLADLHFFSPRWFEVQSKKLGMKLEWHTFDQSRAAGKNLIKDFEKRIPNALRDAKLPHKQENIVALLTWLEKDALTYPWEGAHIGSSGIYHFRKK